jgi:hypothetical protein
MLLCSTCCCYCCMNENNKNISSFSPTSFKANKNKHLYNNPRELKKFDDLLIEFDQKLSQFNLAKTGTFIQNLIEIFCKYVHVDLSAGERYWLIGDLVEKIVRKIIRKMKHTSNKNDFLINISNEFEFKRDKKWDLLKITKDIRTNPSLFSSSNALRRLINSFSSVYESIQILINGIDGVKINSNADNTQNKELRKSINKVDSNLSQEDYQDEDDLKNLKADNSALQEDNSFKQIEAIGVFFQKLEAVLFYLIISFKDDELLLYPLAGHLEECSRIIDIYCSLHSVYKFYYGFNYLNRIKLITKKIIDLLFETRRFEFSQPSEIIAEMRLGFFKLLNILYSNSRDFQILNQNEQENLKQFVDETLDKLLDKFSSNPDIE